MRPLGVFRDMQGKKPGMEELAGALDRADREAANAFDRWMHAASTRGITIDLAQINRQAGLIEHFEALDSILHAYTAIYNYKEEPSDGGLVYKIPPAVAHSAYTAAGRQAEITTVAYASLLENAATDRDLARAGATGQAAAVHSAHVAAALSAFAGATKAARDAHAASRSAFAVRDDGGHTWATYALAVEDAFQFAKDAMVQARNVLYKIEP